MAVELLMSTTTMAANSNTNTAAHNPNANNNNATDEAKPTTIFHDFLGRGCASDSYPALAKTNAAAAAAAAAGEVLSLSETSLSTVSASIGASSGGGRGPISTTSDLASERQTGSHFEGVPFYGSRSDFSGPDMTNRLAGSKHSNSDSGFMGSSREVFQQTRPESLENSHWMKMLRIAGGERPRRPKDEETVFNTPLIRPNSASLILQPPTAGRSDANVSKWERAIPMNAGATLHYPHRAGQVAPFGYQAPLKRFKEANAGPSVISQAAADEGSRTGFKGSGVLASVNVSGGVSDRNLSGTLPSSSKQKPGTLISEPESSTPSSRQGLTSASRQMTIFYGGQAHVFDDVHPNKADVIMALAGSNGGSWSTSYTPESSIKPSSGENYVPNVENDTNMVNNIALPSDIRQRFVTGNASHGFGPFGHGDRISIPPGGIVIRDLKTTVQAAEPSEEKREV